LTLKIEVFSCWCKEIREKLTLITGPKRRDAVVVPGLPVDIVVELDVITSMPGGVRP
jgi:hypothetical protein